MLNGHKRLSGHRRLSDILIGLRRFSKHTRQEGHTGKDTEGSVHRDGRHSGNKAAEAECSVDIKGLVDTEGSVDT